MKPLHFLVAFIILFIHFNSYSCQSCTDVGILASLQTFDSEIQQLLYAREDRTEMYVRTEQKIYHTNNSGSSWTDITSKIPGYYNTTLSAMNGKYGVYWMTTAHDSIVYLQGYGYVFWMTRDGNTFKMQSTYPNYLYSIKPHPTDYQYALRLIYMSNLRYYQLQISDQGGMGDSWAPVKDNVTSYTWGGLHDQIYAIGMPDGSSKWSGAESRFFIFNIDEGYNTASLTYESEPGYTAMLFTEDILYIGKQNPVDPSYLDLYLSDDFGNSFSPAVFTNPQNQQVNTTKYFVESSNEEVSLIVSTLPTNSHVGDLYTADVTDAQYTISLPNIVVSSYATDIQEIYALRGTYFANVYDITEEQRNDPNAVINNKIKSAITFDKGGVWRPISLINSSCSEQNCSLNLFSYTSDSSPLRSTNFSVGVVLGTGNEGQYRKPIEEDANLYLSRNGGYSFEMIRQGLWDYSSADHSSLLVISSWEESSNFLSYSWDQGESWNDCMYSDPIDIVGYSNITLDAIRSIGQISDRKFIIIGDVQNNQNSSEILSVIVSLDFSQVPIPECEGYDTAGGEDSDYEIWTPETSAACSLGVQTSYVRRKRSSACYSPHDESSSSFVPCLCTRSDYTCDGECWEEKREGGETVCVNICTGTPYDPQLPPSPCIGYYTQSQGYRKVSGDLCEGGDSHLYEPILVTCPSPSSTPTPSTTLSPSLTPSVTSTQTFSPSTAPSTSSSPSPISSPDPSSSPALQSDPTQTSSSNGGSSNGDGNDDGNDNNDNNDNGIVIGLTILSVLIILIILFIILIILIVLYKTNSRVRNILSKCLPSRCKETDEKKLYSVLGEDVDFDNSLTAHFTELDENPPNFPVTNNSSILSPLPVLFKPDEN